MRILFFPVIFADGPFTGTPPTYGYDADRAEEQRRHHDILPYIDDSPSSSPHLSSKSRSSRDTLSSGSIESSKSVSHLLASQTESDILIFWPLNNYVILQIQNNWLNKYLTAECHKWRVILIIFCWEIIFGGVQR